MLFNLFNENIQKWNRIKKYYPNFQDDKSFNNLKNQKW